MIHYQPDTHPDTGKFLSAYAAQRVLHRLLAGVCLALCAGLSSSARGGHWAESQMTCHWTGKVTAEWTGQWEYEEGRMPIPQSPYAHWTNANNWAGGTVPGRIVVVASDGSVSTNGCAGCTAVFDGDCDVSCIDLSGLVSISNVVVAGEAAPRFVFGHTSYAPEGYALYIEQGGSVRVAADVPAAPYIVPKTVVCDISGARPLLTIENSSVGPLVFNDLYCMSQTWIDRLGVRFEGSGETRQLGSVYFGGGYPEFVFAQTGGKYVAASSAARTVYLGDVDTGAAQRIEIPEGCRLTTSLWGAGDGVVRTLSGMTISGGGELLAACDASAPVLCAAAGKVLDLSATLARPAGLSGAAAGVAVGQAGFPGTVRLSGANAFTGIVSVAAGAVLEVPSLGAGDAAGPAGTRGVSLAGGSALRWTGSAETTDRSLHVGDSGVLSLAGSGRLVWTGALTGEAGSSLAVTNASGSAVFVCETAECGTSLVLSSGASLSFKAPDGGSTVAVDSLVLDGDATVCVEKGTVVTVGSFARSRGRLTVVLYPGARISIQGNPEDFSGDWLEIIRRSGLAIVFR